MHSGELLQTSHWPEALYGPLPSRMQAGRRIDARQPHPSSPKRQCVSIHHPDVADLDEFTGSTCGGGKGCRHQEQSPNPCTGFVRETSASYCLFPQSFAVFCAFPSMREPVIFPVKPEMTVISSGGGFGWRRGRDSNPRDGSPPTPLAGVRLRPLGHLSARVDIGCAP